jgi:hypothetical protein
LLAVLRQFVLNRWYINRFFYKAIVYPMIGGCMWALKKIELGVIDRFNYVLANATAGFSNSFRKTHSGILTHNVEGIILGFVVFFLLLALTVMG